MRTVVSLIGMASILFSNKKEAKKGGRSFWNPESGIENSEKNVRQDSKKKKRIDSEAPLVIPPFSGVDIDLKSKLMYEIEDLEYQLADVHSDVTLMGAALFFKQTNEDVTQLDPIPKVSRFIHDNYPEFWHKPIPVQYMKDQGVYDFYIDSVNRRKKAIQSELETKRLQLESL